MNSIRVASRARVLLVLGRVSNLPTVWSNCLAAWSLGGGGDWTRFAWLCLGATLLYTGGMFLNDACDSDFDRQFRPERPIPSGAVRAQTVWLGGAGLLLLGWGAWLPLGVAPAAFGTALLAAIVLYDAIHKKTLWAPVLMASCRLLLYLASGAAADSGFNALLLCRAFGLAAYISGISYLARGESLRGVAPPWAVGLLFLPSLLGLVLIGDGWHSTLALDAILTAWLLWSLRGPLQRPPRPLSLGVAGLLAGIVLVDWLAAAPFTPRALAFPGLFLLALALQRVAPAT